MIPVVFKSYISSPPRGYWDMTFLEWLLAQRVPGGYEFSHQDLPDSEQGIVLVTPGHWRDATEINEDLRGRPWVLLIITSDEEGECPFWQISHPNISIWKHTPRAELPWQPDRILPLGWTPGTIEANADKPSKEWGLDWFFAGQITHGRREEAAQVMRGMPNGKLIETDHFLAMDQGINHQEYFDMLRRAKVIPCPSGPMIPDTFRFYEALECGAVPVADATCPRGDAGYWQRALGEVPFPIASDWQTLPEMVEEFRTQQKRVEVLAWWELAKRQILWRLHDDIARLSHRPEEDRPPVEERITVLVSTSAIPSHPDTRVIETTMASIKLYLPNSEIVVMADGPHSGLEPLREAYTEYLERLVWLCRKWAAVPLIFDFQHQANMTRRALEIVRTPLLLFMEHDTPLTGEIPFPQLGYFILNDNYHLVRFHHENAIPNVHDWLMRGQETYFKDGRDYRFMRTVQWSQRPHLARTDRYREWLDKHFPVTSRTYIEDRMHGIVEKAKWDEFKLAIYYPRRGIQRSLHLDGREGASKFEEFMTL